MSALSRLDALLAWYGTLTPETLARLPEFYAVGAQFIDPFNDVHGLPAIDAIFRDMFARLQQPRFIVTDVCRGAREATLIWEFHYLRAHRPGCIRGATLLRFDDGGRVSLHRDYWDAAGELYAHLPVLGVLMRALRRRLAAPVPAG